MNLNDVFKLIDAGFTADEIRNMSGAGFQASPASPVVDPEPVEMVQENTPVEYRDLPTKTEPAEAEQPEAEHVREIGEVFNSAIENLNRVMDESIKKIQTANVQAARMPDDKPASADELIAKIIAPELGKRKREG